MSETEQQTQVSYEQALRVIGRYLDAEPTYHLSVVEVADGFTVRSHASRFKSDGRTVQFTWDRLNDLLVYHTAGRGLSRRHHRHRGIWADFPNGHEDFFRALGFQLDSENASSLTVDEVPEGVTVSYMRPDKSAAADAEFETCHTVMRKAEIQAMLETAQARREAGRAS
ncbi:MAG TPA: hypothetical protein VF221_04285 [Chloroflexota bacterium]